MSKFFVTFSIIVRPEESTGLQAAKVLAILPADGIADLRGKQDEASVRKLEAFVCEAGSALARSNPNDRLAGGWLVAQVTKVDDTGVAEVGVSICQEITASDRTHVEHGPLCKWWAVVGADLLADLFNQLTVDQGW